MLLFDVNKFNLTKSISPFEVYDFNIYLTCSNIYNIQYIYIYIYIYIYYILYIIYIHIYHIYTYITCAAANNQA